MFIFILKFSILFLLSIVIVPVIFFLMFGLFGNYFSLVIDKESWIAKTKIKWVRKVVKRFFV
jgi:hypothetical protein